MFTAITENTGSQVTAGTVELVDDDSGTAMFDVSGMLPGDSEGACDTVSGVATTGYTDSSVASLTT